MTDTPRGRRIGGTEEFTEPMLTKADFDVQFAPDDVGTLLRIRFARGIAVYTADFELHIVGSLWPRELDALNGIIKLYKEQNKKCEMKGDKE